MLPEGNSSIVQFFIAWASTICCAELCLLPASFWPRGVNEGKTGYLVLNFCYKRFLSVLPEQRELLLSIVIAM